MTTKIVLQRKNGGIVRAYTYSKQGFEASSFIMCIQLTDGEYELVNSDHPLEDPAAIKFRSNSIAALPACEQMARVDGSSVLCDATYNDQENKKRVLGFVTEINYDRKKDTFYFTATNYASKYESPNEESYYTVKYYYNPSFYNVANLGVVAARLFSKRKGLQSEVVLSLS